MNAASEYEHCASMGHPYEGDVGDDGRCRCGEEWFPKGGYQVACQACEGSGVVFEDHGQGMREALGCADCGGHGEVDGRWLWTLDNVLDQLDGLTQSLEGAGCDAVRLVISTLWFVPQGMSLDAAFAAALEERVKAHSIEPYPSGGPR